MASQRSRRKPLKADRISFKVAAVVIERKRLLLLSEPTKSWLTLPGGLAEPGETWEETLRREVREELGCGVKPLEWWGMWRGPARHGPRPFWHAILIRAKLNGNPAAHSEIGGLHWLTKREALKRKIAPSAAVAIREAASRGLM